MEEKKPETVSAIVQNLKEVEENGALHGFYCFLCRAKMSSQLTWDLHVNGQRHIKAKRSARYGLERPMTIQAVETTTKEQLKVAGGARFIKRKSRDEVASIQSDFNVIRNEPIVGLDYIQEIWRKDQSTEPVYHCSLCTADCQRITIVDHVIGYRHRILYLRTIDIARYKYFSASVLRKSELAKLMANEMRKVEKAKGKGVAKVAIEISDDEDDGKEEFSDKSNNDGPSFKETGFVIDKNPRKRKRQVAPPELRCVDQISPQTIKKEFEKLSLAKQRKIVEKIPLGCALPEQVGNKAELEKLQELKACYYRYLLESLPKDQLRAIVDQIMEGIYDWSHNHAQEMLEGIDLDN